MKRIAALALLAALAGCAFVPVPTLEDAGGDAALKAELVRGRDLYVRKCSGCHALHSVTLLGDREWPKQVWEMMTVEKVKLTDPDRAKLILYLTTMNGRD